MTQVRQRTEGSVGHVLLNRPQARNAVTVELARELAAAVEALAREVRVIVIRGAGADFCAGGDVGALATLHARGRAAMAELFTEFRRALTTITSAPVPVVAAVHGHAVAGGFELMQACDIAVVRTDARISDIHSRFGQVPGGGSTQRLPRIVGRQRAMGLILTGDEISGAQAVAWGLAYRAAEPGRFDEEVDSLVERLVANPPAAMAHSKFLVDRALEHPLDAGLPVETTRVLDHLEAEGQAAFGAFTRRKVTT
ncbi:enoyl-CoA hydratase/isomerase family protein [Amycolatopsis alkalitolerans]|uniref:Enoyl-CoA hydratase/isomerase family protein n=1 Tax=Amycolatopsis alkalitolerans TaxID=2547244 RepID=A0A5C4M289_9PSEU|nr:enoyl-CoA hydratase/isomerase family protein [Amycolatopsis alkalitolerans]TNC25129.1 enoyl-CoA hydratase/isomerase family protein [Amycolatopsis alkalitolerans]